MTTPSHIASGSSLGTFGSGETISGIATGSGDNRSILAQAFVWGGSASNITGATLGGVALTQTNMGSMTGLISGTPVVCFRLQGSSMPSGTQSLVVSNDSGGASKTYVEYAIHDNTSVAGAPVMSQASSTNANTTVSTGTGHLVVALGFTDALGTRTPQDAAVERYGSATTYGRFVVDEVASGASININTTLAPSSPTPNWLMTAFDLTGTADTTPPTLTGSLTVTPGSTTASVLCPTGSDDVGVVAYDASIDGGATWPFTSATTTITLTGLSPSTAYTVKGRDRDAAGNVSTPLLSADFTTTAVPDTTLPVMAGTLTVTPSLASASVLCPTASDNVGVTAYDVSIDSGTTWPFTSATTTVSVTGLSSGTTYTARARARDAAGNTSTPVLSQAFTTTTLGSITLGPFDSGGGTPWASGTSVKCSWYSGGRIGALTGITPIEQTITVGGGGTAATASNLPKVAGLAICAKWVTNETTDLVYYQAGTPA